METDNTGMQKEYIARINRVIDYIDEHLSEELTLEMLANVAMFSPYHFHRIFSALVGESLGRFIQRLRLEKAAMLLVSNPSLPVTTIALDCGFSGSAPFARSFRDAFGMTASDWRKKCIADSKNYQTSGNHGKEFTESSMYLDCVHKHITWRVHMNDKEMNVTVQELPDMPVAYVRHIGPYKGDVDLFGRLINKIMTWAGPRGIMSHPEFQLLAIYHDNPDITDEEKLRLSMAVTVPAGTPTGGEIGSMTLPGGQYAIAHFELSTDEYENAWKMVYGAWLPQSGYQPVDSPCFERYLNDPKDHPEGKCIVDICIPVKPM